MKTGVAAGALVAVLLIGGAGRAPAQTSARVEALGQAGGATIAVRASGGRAYVGVGARVEILDVASPDAPTLLGRGPALGEVVQDVAVEGSLAYVAEGALDERGIAYPSASQGGLRVLDVGDPSRPRALGFLAAGSAPMAVAVAGSRAYLATGEGGLLIVDVSDPAQPRPLATYQAFGSTTYDVVLGGQYAYLADGNALDVVDVSDPANPRTAARFPIPPLGPGALPPARGLTLVGSRVYLAETAFNTGMIDFQGGGLRIVDVSDPTNPRQLGAFRAGPGGAYGRRVAVAGDRAYLTTSITERHGGGGALEELDVSDPASPRLLTPGRATTNNASGLAIVGSRVYVAVGSGLAVYDVSTPGSPRQVAKRGTPMNAGRVVVSGRHAYVSGGRGGLSVVDVGDRSAPAVIGHYDPGTEVSDLAVDGATVYLGVAGSEGQTLRALDVSDPTRPTPIGGLSLPIVRAVAVAPPRVYVLTYERLVVVDTSDPRRLRELGSLALGGTAMRAAGSRAYVTNFESFTSGFFVVDVADPTRPTIVHTTRVFDTYDLATGDGRVYLAELNSATRQSQLRVLTGCAGSPDRLETASTLALPQARGVAARGGLLLLADESAGLVLVDAADPRRPAQLATGGRAPGRGVAVDGETAFLGSGPLGLQLLRATADVGPLADARCRALLPAVPQRDGV